MDQAARACGGASGTGLFGGRVSLCKTTYLLTPARLPDGTPGAPALLQSSVSSCIHEAAKHPGHFLRALALPMCQACGSLADWQLYFPQVPSAPNPRALSAHSVVENHTRLMASTSESLG